MVSPAKFINSLQPYSITPQDVWSPESEGEILKLDWNEAPFDFDFYKHEAGRIVKERGVLAWYPDYLSIELTDKLSSYLNISDANILTFPGSDVGLETLCRAYLDHDDTAIAICPTYENFFVYVTQCSAKLEKINLEPPFIFDIELIDQKIRSTVSPKIVYIVSPNNPCGYYVEQGLISSLAERYQKTLFVIDEAYIEFSDSESCVNLISDLPNIVVARTFSKAFGLAGIRIGYLCASLPVVDAINKIRNGKNVSMIAQRLALYALNNIGKIESWVSDVKLARSVFESWCLDNKIKCYPSHGNFILFHCRKPNELCSELKANGVYVRNRNSLIEGCVRITIGNTQQTMKVINLLSNLSYLL